MNMKAFFEQKKLCEACSARKDAKQVVLPEFNNTKFWILGRNPGKEENEAGVPFVGRGGRMLDSWLDIIDLPRSLFIIENPVACYTEKDRPPTSEERKACFYWLEQELSLLKPVLVVTLGNDALQVMLRDSKVSVTNMHGLVVPSKFGDTKVFPTFHPGHCLRNPYYRSLVEQEDLPKLKGVIDAFKINMARRETETSAQGVGFNDGRISRPGGD